jgi:hypothetical protein
LLKREGEGCFVEDDMVGDDDSVGGKIKTTIALVIRRIPEESTKRGSRC